MALSSPPPARRRADRTAALALTTALLGCTPTTASPSGPPAPIAHDLGLVRVGPWAVQLRAHARGERVAVQGAQGPRTRWHLEITAEGTVGPATGPLGALYRCTAETALSDALVGRQVQGLRLESAVRLIAVAALRMRPSETWQLPCPAPSPRWAGLYAATDALFLTGPLVEADNGPRALAELPGPEAWLRDTLDAPRRDLPPDAPALRPLVRAMTLPAGLDAPIADLQSAYVLAAVSGVAVDAALARSLWSTLAGFAPEADARLLERVTAGEPLVLGTLRRALTEGVTGHTELADVVWGRMLGGAVALDAETDAAMLAGLTRCEAEPSRSACGAWTFGAIAAYAARRQDDPTLARLVRATMALPRSWWDPGSRSEVRVEALRAAQAATLPATRMEAARAVLSGADDAPLRTARCVGVPAATVRSDCRDPRMVAAAMLVGECDPATRTAATTGLSVERHAAVAAAACVLVRCGGTDAARTALEAARPGHRFNAVALALVPRWCRAGDAGP